MAENPQRVAAENKAAAAPLATTIVVEKRSSFPTVALLLAVALAAGGGVSWFVSQSRASGSEHGQAAQSPGQLIHLEGFTVNLADAEENDFVRVTMDLDLDRMPAPADKEKPASGLPMARIRDTIIAVLAASKTQPLLTTDGKLQLKKTLREELNRRVPEMNVRDIYFTEFLVQR
jgi:flagellar FliL protein